MHAQSYIQDFSLRKHGKQWRFIAVSLLVHACFGILILVSINFGSNTSLQDKQTEAQTLNSYIFVAPKSIPEQTNMSIEEQTAPSPDLIESHSTIPEQTKVQDLPEKRLETPNQKPVTNSSKQLIEHTQNTTVLTSNSDKAELVIPKRSPLKTMTNNMLQNYKQQQNAMLAQQAASEYQRKKVSPDINTQTAIDTTIWQPKRPKHEIACTNAASKALALTAGLLNSTIQCEDNSHFKQFIEARVNKEN